MRTNVADEAAVVVAMSLQKPQIFYIAATIAIVNAIFNYGRRVEDELR